MKAQFSIIVCLLALTLVAPATRAKRHPPGGGTAYWQLVDNHQNVCLNVNSSTAYYGIWIKGTWNHPIDVGLDNIPNGGTFTTSYTPIPPGSSTGEYSLAYAAAHIPAGTATGTYTLRLWANDGSSWQSVPVTLIVAQSCSNY
jgi:uncharacterized protein DUF5980